MALPIPPVNPNTQIPNNPFYYPETNYLKGEYGPFIVGSGFSINNITGTIEVSGGGSGAPTILAGAGIAVTSGTGTVTITNTGIRTVTAGAGISVSVSSGNLNIVNTAPFSGVPGTVTEVETGTGLTGGPITTTGAISLAPVTTVSPGTYSNPTITVDAYGRVTYAAPGPGSLGSLLQATAPLSVNASIPQTISIANASTSAPGAVQLNTSTNSTSTTQAATPSAVKAAFDLATSATSDASTALSAATTASSNASAAQVTANNALSTATSAQTAAVAAQNTANTALLNAAAAQATADAAIPCASFTAKGQLLAANGPGTYSALSPGTNGQILVACSACSSGLTWVTQPVSSGTVTSISTGPGLLGGPITTTGTISLAPTGVTPNTYTYATVSVDSYGRVTAAGVGVPPIPCACITGKGAILTGTAPNSPLALPVGADGRVLTACSACPTGLAWTTNTSAAIPCSCVTAKGTLISGTAPGVVTSLPVGADGYVLTADSTCTDGLKWAAAASPTTPATPTTEGVLYGYSDNATNFATSLGYEALNTTVTGPGNVAIGTSAGCSLTTGQLNTYVGSGAGCANTTGNNNIALGAQSLFAHASGDCNIAIGNLAGLNLTTESGNVILGPYQAEVGCDNNVYIADGTGTLRIRVNEDGALALGGGGYGTSGQVLTSGGPGSTPTWTTVASSGGTVTSITAGTGLSGGTITTTGTIALANTAVTAGSYTNASITVDAQGRLTSASSGASPVTAVTGTAPISVTTGTTPDVSIASASTTAPGAVQLYNNTDSTSTTLALTAAQGKNLQDQITALSTAPNIDLAGTIDASTGLVDSVTSVGTSAGYTNNAALPAASATTVNTYVVVTTAGTFTPPGGSSTTATKGDWFLASETSPGVYAWQFLNVGFDAPAATTSVAGVVCLSTNALAQAGTDTTTALTPAAAASAYIPKTCITAKGALITGTAASAPVALTVGTDGQVLTACSAAPGGLCWAPAATASIPCACLGAKGSLVTATAAATPVNLPVGTDGQALVACAACPTGLTWTTPAVPVSAATPTVAGIVLGCTNAANIALGCNAFLSSVGVNNIAIGLCALPVNQQSDNIAIGTCALKSSTTGFQNTALGHIAMCSLVCDPASPSASANQNVAVGSASLCAMTKGLSNDAFGALSMNKFTSGCYNVAVGGYSLFSYISGNFNTAVGHRALDQATGCCNTAIGGYAGCNITTGCGNVSLGQYTTVPNPAGNNQLAIGYAAGCNWITGDSNKNIRPGAGIIDCASSTGVACQVLASTANGIQWRNAADITVGINAVARMEVSSGNLPNNNSSVEVSPPSVTMVTNGEWNPLGWFNTANGRFTPTIAGYYQVDAYVTANSNNTNIWAGIYKNGNLVTQSIQPLANNGNWQTASVSTVVYMNGSTDYLRLGAASQGATPSFITVASMSGMAVSLVGANVAITNPVPGWVSAGTIQSVGWTSVGGIAVVPGTTSRNNVNYRQLGPKEWEAVYSFTATGNFANVGSGNYLFTLPNGLQFDTTLPFQRQFSTAVGPNWSNNQYYIPSSSGFNAFTNDSNSSIYGEIGVVPYSTTQFRVFSTDINNSRPQPVSNAYWGGQSTWTFTYSFQFTSA